MLRDDKSARESQTAEKVEKNTDARQGNNKMIAINAVLEDESSRSRRFSSGSCIAFAVACDQFGFN
jgi:hypothetical protein